MGVVRDYIPADSEPTDEERRVFMRTVQGIPGGSEKIVADFVPAEGHVTAHAKSTEEQLAEVFANARRAQEQAAQVALDDAYDILHRNSVAQVVDYLREAGDFDRDTTLVVEAATQARKTILDQFPPPSEAVISALIEE